MKSGDGHGILFIRPRFPYSLYNTVAARREKVRPLFSLDPATL
jgi:hypothetical protein